MSQYIVKSALSDKSQAMFFPAREKELQLCCDNLGIANDMKSKVVVLEIMPDRRLWYDVGLRKQSGRRNVELNITFRSGDEPSVYCVANDYDILDSDDSRLIFLFYNENIGYDKPAENPILYYDGKEHALLLCDNFKPLLCDFINEQMRPKLLLQKSVTFVFVTKDENGDKKIGINFEAPLTTCDDIHRRTTPQ